MGFRRTEVILMALLAAVIIGGLLIIGLKNGWTAKTGGSTPAGPTSPASFTWEGKTWDCAQVNQWQASYGAYETDGTPIPYEVVTGCLVP